MDEQQRTLHAMELCPAHRRLPLVLCCSSVPDGTEFCEDRADLGCQSGMLPFFSLLSPLFLSAFFFFYFLIYFLLLAKRHIRSLHNPSRHIHQWHAPGSFLQCHLLVYHHISSSPSFTCLFHASLMCYKILLRVRKLLL